MKTTKAEIWDGYVRAVMPALVAKYESTEEAVDEAVVMADRILELRGQRFASPVVGVSPEVEADETRHWEAVLRVFEAEGAESGLRGPEIVRKLRGEIPSEEVYEALEGLVEEGLLWLELDRVPDRTFGREQESNAVTYLKPERLREYDAGYAAKVEAAGGVLVTERYDRKKMPGWVKQLLAQKQGGEK